MIASNFMNGLYLSGRVDVPDGLVVGRRRIGHELHPDDLGGLVQPEGDWRQRPDEVFRREENHQLPVCHRSALPAEKLVAVRVHLVRLALDVLAAVVSLDLRHIAPMDHPLS